MTSAPTVCEDCGRRFYDGDTAYVGEITITVVNTRTRGVDAALREVYRCPSCNTTAVERKKAST